LASPDRCAHVERLYHDMLARDEGERATPASWTCSDGRPPFHRLLSNVADEQHPIMRLQPFRKVGICSVQATLDSPAMRSIDQIERDLGDGQLDVRRTGTVRNVQISPLHRRTKAAP